MRLNRVHVPASNTAGSGVARRGRRWKLVSASAVAAFALGYGVTSAVHQATAQPLGSASRALAPLGTGIVDPAVRPYLNPKLLKEVPVGPGKVSKPVRMALISRP